MRLSGKLQMAKNRKHYCRPVLKSCDFHFGVGHLLEQRLGHCCAWAEGQRCTVPKSHVHACFKTLLRLKKVVWSSLALSSLVLCLSMQNFAPVSGLALDPYSSNASLRCPYPAQNSWPPSELQATAGPYGVHINSKDKAGMQRNRTQHIFNHLCDRSRFSILSSISSIQRRHQTT